MARPILAEEQNTVHKGVVEDVSPVKKNLESDNDEYKMIIRADEMEKLFHEWDANGKNDLYVNSTLAERIEEYIEYQEKMDPLRKKMAARIYAPFKVDDNKVRKASADVELNDIPVVTNIDVFEYAGSKRVIRINDFKIILGALNNPYAYWIDETGLVDLKGYILSIGGSYSYNDSPYTPKIKLKFKL